tara:strand:+ start:365 stop:469 length:105 start_codon:yes stop_codon:yes gene_type:complete
MAIGTIVIVAIVTIKFLIVLRASLKIGKKEKKEE